MSALNPDTHVASIARQHPATFVLHDAGDLGGGGGLGAERGRGEDHEDDAEEGVRDAGHACGFLSGMRARAHGKAL